MPMPLAVREMYWALENKSKQYGDYLSRIEPHFMPTRWLKQNGKVGTCECKWTYLLMIMLHESSKNGQKLI